ncbi:transcriptional regulator VisR [Pararhizobium sp.]|uniref:transcriptional regulator VisR n=1 Tax=Pararhizobium sp. TaxID=1977563 RepID=UPI00271FB20F|nr:helix-turn-helix transcriptional regulator [Pararhizobium sp.]MDO9416077.1 helix-turn-helix transcriptional regulator [Pararhizobium sp.]
MDSQPLKSDRPAEDAKTARENRLLRQTNFTVRLQSMQKQLNAKHYAVFRITGNGLPASRKLACIMENWGAAAEINANAVTATYGDAMRAHLETSMLPVVWNGGGEHQAAETQDIDRLTFRLRGGLLPFSGVGFPVRLGAQGNGYVLLSGGYIEISGDMLVDLHGRCCQLMSDILGNEAKRKSAIKNLSERELACLQMAADGCISEEIAVNMGLSVHTVNAYLGVATTKLDSVNRVQAIAKAIRLGYIN